MAACLPVAPHISSRHGPCSAFGVRQPGACIANMLRSTVSTVHDIELLPHTSSSGIAHSGTQAKRSASKCANLPSFARCPLGLVLQMLVEGCLQCWRQVRVQVHHRVQVPHTHGPQCAGGHRLPGSWPEQLHLKAYPFATARKSKEQLQTTAGIRQIFAVEIKL